MKEQKTTSSQAEAQSRVWNTSFLDTITYENFQYQGRVLYVGYISPSQRRDLNPFAKILRLVAYDTNDKHMIWERTFIYEENDMSVYATIAFRLKVVDSILYVFGDMTNGVSASWLFALDAQSGQDIWQHKGPGGTNMTIGHGIVFLRDTQLHALDGKTGQHLWSYAHMDKRDSLENALAVTSDAVFLMGASLDMENANTFVRCLHLSSGEERWNMQLNSMRSLFTFKSLLATENTIFAVTNSMKTGADVVYALQAQNGALRWTSQEGIYSQPLLVTEDVLYLSRYEYVTELNTLTGELLRTRELKGEGSGQYNFYTLPDHEVYGCELMGTLSAFDIPNSKIRWSASKSLPLSIGTHITIDKKSVYMTTMEQDEIVALDRETGVEQQYLQSKNDKGEIIQIIAVG